MERPNGVTVPALPYGLGGMVGGICLFAFAYGAWQLKPWAWRLGIVITVVAPVVDMATAGVNPLGSIPSPL